MNYFGNASIDGVPGTAAPVPIEFKDTAGSSCGALLPTGNVQDIINGVEVTMIDNGMPCVILRASDMHISGNEAAELLEDNISLKDRIEAIRLACGPLMNLGDVSKKSIPKMTLVSSPMNDGTVSTRTFIPHRCHKAIGVLGAVSVATACLIEGTVAYDSAKKGNGVERHISIEHPTGEMTVIGHLNEFGEMKTAAILRTARKLMDGEVFA